MRALFVDDIPVLFDTTGDITPETVDEYVAGMPEAWRQSIGLYVERLTLRDYDDEYPLRAHMLIVSLAMLEEVLPQEVVFW